MLSSGLAAVLIVLLLFAALPVQALEAGQEAPVFELRDQFDENWSTSELKGKVVVLIVATPKSGEAMEPWISGLEEMYGDKIEIVGMMNLNKLPGFIRSIAKSRIKKETQQPLMLDYTGITSTNYGANDKSPVVVVIDRNSRIQTVAGSHSEESFTSTAAVIDKLLEAGSEQASVLK